MADTPQNKHRKEFLVLLAALGVAFVHLRNQYQKRILGALLALANKDGIIESRRLQQVAGAIQYELTHLRYQFEREFEEHQDAAIQFGAAIGGESFPSPSTQAAAGEVLKQGALGVPFSMVAAGAVIATANAISGAVTRASLKEEQSVKDIQLSLDAALEKFTDKMIGEGFTQLNGAFVAATTEVVKDNAKVEELLYVLNPVSDRHCVWCSSHSGNIYPKSHSVWQEIPHHPNCYCYGLPILSRAGVEHNQELVQA